MKEKKIGKSTIWQMLQDYRFNSVLVRNFVMILGILFAVFSMIMLVVSKRMDTLTEQEVQTVSENSLKQTAQRMDTVMNEVIQISVQLSLDDDIMNFLLADMEDSSVNHEETLVARTKLKQYADIFSYVDSIYVYSSRSRYLVTEEWGGNIGEFDDLTWYSNFNERIYEPARMISRPKANKYPYLITYIQPVRLSQMHFLGGIIVNVDVERLGEFAVAETDETIMIVDRRNHILFTTNENYKKEKWKETDADVNKMLLQEVESETHDWKYVSLVPREKYQHYRRELKRFVVYMMGLISLCSTIAAVAISIYSYQPVGSIVNLLKDPQAYQPSKKNGFRKDETQTIIQNIAYNFYSNNKMQKELQDYLAMTNQAQLTALQAQISPHFLYNTLENIRWKVIELCRGDNEASQMILKLSELLRISLDDADQIISIEQEVRNTRLYVDILQLRYESKLEVRWNIPEGVQKCAIVKVSLQPLIENAVYHGIKPKREKGIIQVHAEKDSEKLKVTIQDDGIGMDPEECRILNEDLRNNFQFKKGHIGVRNVNQRLKLLLGDQAQMKVISEKGKGTCVQMELPYREVE